MQVGAFDGDGLPLTPSHKAHEGQTKQRVEAPDGATMVADNLTIWLERYLRLAVIGIRPEEVARRVAYQLRRFLAYYKEVHGYDLAGACQQGDVAAWQQALRAQGLAAATVNHHLVALSAFTAWLTAQDPHLLPLGDPANGVRKLDLPPREPRGLSDLQLRSLKRFSEALPRLMKKRGRRWVGMDVGPHAHRRPWRDRALVLLILSTGLSRAELVRLDLEQVRPGTPEELRAAERATITGVVSKAKIERTIVLADDARAALADYLRRERPLDSQDGATALLFAATGIPRRTADGRLSPSAITKLMGQIGRWHDAEASDPAARLASLQTQDLRHTFAAQLARSTSADSGELQRRLGLRSPRYLRRYLKAQAAPDGDPGG